jgi:hypothetical protein
MRYYLYNIKIGAYLFYVYYNPTSYSYSWQDKTKATKFYLSDIVNLFNRMPDQFNPNDFKIHI